MSYTRESSFCGMLSFSEKGQYMTYAVILDPNLTFLKCNFYFWRGTLCFFFSFSFHFSNTSTRKFGIYSSRSVSRQAPWFTLPKITKITDTGKNHLTGQMRNFSLKRASPPPLVLWFCLFTLASCFFLYYCHFTASVGHLLYSPVLAFKCLFQASMQLSFSFVFFSPSWASASKNCINSLMGAWMWTIPCCYRNACATAYLVHKCSFLFLQTLFLGCYKCTG